MTALHAAPAIRNKVNWAIEPDRCALLLHDLQPHYLNPLPEAERRRVVGNAALLAEDCRARGIPVFASLVPIPGERCERGLMAEMWGRGPSAEAGGLDEALGLEPDSLRVVTKRGYSAFYGNDFEVLLRRLGRDSLLIAGIYTSVGCHASAMDAFMRDIRVFLVSDAAADLTEADHRAGLESAARTCARVVDTGTARAALSRRRGGRAAPSVSFDVC